MQKSNVRRKQPENSPFRYSRHIRFGDTDAAGIVYTGRVPDIALEALEVWFNERLRLNWYEMRSSSAVDLPCVHLDCDFRSPMTPRDILDIVVLMERATGASIQVRLLARAKADGVLRWQSRFVFACVDVKTFRPASIPKSWQKLLEAELSLTLGASAIDSWNERMGHSGPESKLKSELETL